MAVKVTLLDAPWEENFEAEDDMFSERKDGTLEIHRARFASWWARTSVRSSRPSLDLSAVKIPTVRLMVACAGA